MHRSKRTFSENIQNVCNYCEELRIKGTPSINNIEFIMVSVLNNTDQTVFGNVWLDELRMTGVKKEKGQAFRLKGSIAFSDLAIILSEFDAISKLNLKVLLSFVSKCQSSKIVRYPFVMTLALVTYLQL